MLFYIIFIGMYALQFFIFFIFRSEMKYGFATQKEVKYWSDSFPIWGNDIQWAFMSCFNIFLVTLCFTILYLYDSASCRFEPTISYKDFNCGHEFFLELSCLRVIFSFWIKCPDSLRSWNKWFRHPTLEQEFRQTRKNHFGRSQVFKTNQPGVQRRQVEVVR